MKGEWIRKPSNSNLTVVFVHGFLSNGKDCWKNEASDAYWPEILKNESEHDSIGIYVYTYQTDFFSGSYSLGDVVDDLKERLQLDHVLSSKALVFVCHSMGGIVVRRYLVSREHDLKDVAVGLYLVASPSLGSNYANWLEPIAQLMNHSQADVLRFSQNNQWLNDLNKDFKNLIGTNRLAIRGKEITEDKFVILVKLRFLKQVVEPLSGALYFPEPYKLPGSDHFSIAKPENKDSTQHRLLLKFIEVNFSQIRSLQQTKHKLPHHGKDNIKTLISYGHTEIIEPDDKLDSRYIVPKNFVSRIRPSNDDSAKEVVSHIREGDPLFDIYSEAQEPYRVIRGIDQQLRKASLSAHVWVSSQPGLGKTVSLRHLAASSK